MSNTFQAVFWGVLAGSAVFYLVAELVDEARISLRSRRLRNLIEALEDTEDFCECD